MLFSGVVAMSMIVLLVRFSLGIMSAIRRFVRGRNLVFPCFLQLLTDCVCALDVWMVAANSFSERAC